MKSRTIEPCAKNMSPDNKPIELVSASGLGSVWWTAISVGLLMLLALLSLLPPVDLSAQPGIVVDDSWRRTVHGWELLADMHASVAKREAGVTLAGTHATLGQAWPAAWAAFEVMMILALAGWTGRPSKGQATAYG